ncbi:hypothetical protein C0431_04260 [bacterium]|nr:hypothetical protein [bacterium]
MELKGNSDDSGWIPSKNPYDLFLKATEYLDGDKVLLDTTPHDWDIESIIKYRSNDQDCISITMRGLRKANAYLEMSIVFFNVFGVEGKLDKLKEIYKHSLDVSDLGFRMSLIDNETGEHCTISSQEIRVIPVRYID